LVGWANAIPDANAVATFNLGGSVLAFKGYGYHDKVRKGATSTGMEWSLSAPLFAISLANFYLALPELGRQHVAQGRG
jgi:hypothetical protein